MLVVEDIHGGYGRVRVLFGLSFTAKAGEITCLMGRNGAGKTTTLRAIMRHVPLTSGGIRLEGRDISALPPEAIAGAGIGYVPQGRRLFRDLTVAENLEIGLMAGGQGPATRARVLDLFPRLGERLNQRAGTLSGGEQQMLAMGRALCLAPRVLLLDEPTEGLQPSMIRLIRDVAIAAREDGVAVVLVEQRVEAVKAIADRVAFVEHGAVATSVSATALSQDPDLVHRYVGV